MATFRRSIVGTSKLFYQHKLHNRTASLFSHINHRDDDEECRPVSQITRTPNVFQHRHNFNYLQNRFLANGNKYTRAINYSLRDGGHIFTRNFSSGSVIEVALAPIAMLEKLVENVHSFSGLNWWASIVVTTFCVGTLQYWGMAFAEARDRKKDPDKLLHVGRVSRLTSSAYFLSFAVAVGYVNAVMNMAEKVPSFKDGGILWFTDLSTTDGMYIFPILTALTTWSLIKKVNTWQGRPSYAVYTGENMGIALITIPMSDFLPMAVSCVWISYNLVYISSLLVTERPGVKKILCLPHPMPKEANWD